MRWGRLLAEGVLIVSSVYLAIFLEGLSQDADRRAEARAGLEQLTAELQLDLDDIARVRGFQVEQTDRYLTLLRLLDTPSGARLDSIADLTRTLSLANYTVYPRKGAWTTLLSGGLLSAVDNRELVVRIADHYENLTVRVEYNGALYDDQFFATLGDPVAEAESWKVTGRVEDLPKFRARLSYFRQAWNEYYIDLLDTYDAAIKELAEDIETHLNES